MGLVDKMKKAAWRDDQLGITAYYVIKNAVGQIVLIFSLKCGVLFDPNYIKKLADTYDTTDYTSMWESVLTPAEKQKIDRILASPNIMVTKEDLFQVDLRRLMQNLEYDALTPTAEKYVQILTNAIGPRRLMGIARDVDYFYGAKSDKHMETNDNIVCVPESYPALELVEFCVNNSAKECWDFALMGGKSMGRTMFWWFIAPKMLEIADRVGCEYVFLFAADSYKDVDENGVGSLIRYYHSLHFQNNSSLGTAKPAYDYQCQFMCQRLHVSADFKEDGLDSHQKNFLWTFNEEQDEQPGADDYA